MRGELKTCGDIIIIPSDLNQTPWHAWELAGNHMCTIGLYSDTAEELTRSLMMIAVILLQRSYKNSSDNFLNLQQIRITLKDFIQVIIIFNRSHVATLRAGGLDVRKYSAVSHIFFFFFYFGKYLTE